MKNNLIFLAMILLAINACKKDRTCTCKNRQTLTVVDKNGAVLSTTEQGTSVSERKYKKVKKNAVVILCSDYTYSQETTNKDSTITTSAFETDCEIK